MPCYPKCDAIVILTKNRFKKINVCWFFLLSLFHWVHWQWRLYEILAWVWLSCHWFKSHTAIHRTNAKIIIINYFRTKLEKQRVKTKLYGRGSVLLNLKQCHWKSLWWIHYESSCHNILCHLSVGKYYEFKGPIG